jgi:hypothetical protein
MVSRARWIAVLTLAVALGIPCGATASMPSLTSFISDPVNLSGATSVAVSGNYAYTTAYYPGRLTAIDMSNPAHVVIAGMSPVANSLYDGSTVNIAGGYAYVASKNRNAANGSNNNDDGTGNSLTVLDIHTNPAQPAIVGSVRDATKLFGAYGVAMSGQYAYVAAQGCLSGQPCPKSNVGNSFEVVDVSNPASPTIVATLHNTNLPAPFTGTNALAHADSTTVSGHYAYVTASYSNRLTIIDISNPIAPKVVSSLLDATNLNFPVDVAVQGNYAYVVDQISTGRLTVVDVSNPANPQVVSSLSNAALNGAYRLRLRRNFAFVSGSSSNAIAAVDISDPLNPRLAASYTDTAHLHRTTGLDLDPTGRYVVANSPYLSTESQALFPPFPLQTGGPTATGSISMIDLDPTPISVAITPSSPPANPTVNTGASFAFTVNDPVSSVQCKLDSAPYSLCSSSTGAQYSSLPAGSHTFTVQATDAAGTTTTDTYTWTVIAAPANTSPPTISGAAVQGGLLSASNGTWSGSPAPTFGYQWQQCDSAGANCAAINGATSQTYSPQSGDVGSTLEVVVIGSNSAGSSSATSLPTPVVVSPPSSTSLPIVTGTAQQGSPLSGSTGSWSGTPAPSFSYQWRDCDTNGVNCSPIGGATSQTYTASAGDVGSTLELAVTGTNTAGSSTATSMPSAVVSAAASAPVNSSLPTISGPATQGQTLTAANGTWSGVPAPSFSYLWQRCDSSGANCSPISSAAAQTYTAQASDIGSTLAVTVTGSNGAGSASATSAVTSVVAAAPAAPVNTAPPSISGAAVEAQMLTAGNGSWSSSPSPSFTYQWQRCSPTGAGCTPISGATAQTYIAVSADVGSTLRVGVTGTSGSGSSAVSSAPSAVVTSAAGPVTGLLDDFNRPNNSGPPGPNWTHMVISSTSASNNVLITNQQLTGTSGSNADYWNQQTLGPNSEAWITVVTKPTADLDPVVLGLRFQNPGLTTASGYQAYYIYRATQADQYKIIVRVNGSTSTTLASATGPTLQPGDQLLFRAIGSTLELWRGSGAAWTRILSATDTTYAGAGYVDLTARDTTVRLDNFGGGTLP